MSHVLSPLSFPIFPVSDDLMLILEQVDSQTGAGKEVGDFADILSILCKLFSGMWGERV